MKPSGLYIHIPFCVRKCPYCDFCSITDSSLQTPYVEALLLEIQMHAPQATIFDTLYLGGGTPSILAVTAIERILGAVGRAYNFQVQAEITIEINPGTIDTRTLSAYRRAGINRVNIGVQSFEPANLIFLGRIHSAAQSVAAIKAAREAGFDNIGIDLIYGLPDQTESAWQADLVKALEFQPEHLACYMLTYESGTPLDEARQNGRVIPLTEDRSARLLALTQQILTPRDYAQYEISNFARIVHGDPDTFRSRHNLKYWSMAPYLGLGPGAHSYAHPIRWWNLEQVPAYIAALDAGRRPIAGRERLNREQQMMEALYLGLRKTVGIDVAAFEKRFAVDFKGHLGQPLADMAQEGVLTLSDNRCALTPKGMRLLDSVLARLV
ncbi:radical SAM family heme chaperone HemW [Thermodesulfobacteriota bacterium]